MHSTGLHSNINQYGFLALVLLSSCTLYQQASSSKQISFEHNTYNVLVSRVSLPTKQIPSTKGGRKAMVLKSLVNKLKHGLIFLKRAQRSISSPATVANIMIVLPFLLIFSIASGSLGSSLEISILGWGLFHSGNSSSGRGSSSSSWKKWKARYSTYNIYYWQIQT